MAAHTGVLGNFSYRVEIDASALVSAAEAARRQTLVELGDYIREESTAIAPLRDGNLIASSYVRPSDDKVEIGYNIVYANYQHEGITFRHPNGRQAEYLRKVMENPNTQAQAEALFARNLHAHIGR